MVSGVLMMRVTRPELQQILDEKNNRIRRLEAMLEDGLDAALYQIYGKEKMQALHKNERESGFVPLPGTEELLAWAMEIDEALHDEITKIPFLRSKWWLNESP